MKNGKKAGNAPASPPLRLLLVKGNKRETGKFLKVLMHGDTGFDVTHCSTEKQALRRVRRASKAYDLALVEHKPRGMNGFQLCLDMLKKKPAFPLVLLVEMGYEKLAAKALLSGVHDYIIRDPKNGYLDFLPTLLPQIVRRYKEQAARVEAEEALRLREALYRRSISEVNAASYQRDYTTHKFLFIDEKIEDLTGYKPEEITPQLWDEIVKECIMLGEAAGQTLNKAADLARKGELKKWHADYRIRTRDGKERWLCDTSIQLHDSKGRRIGSLGILQDITDRKKIEQTLRDQNERLFILNKVALLTTGGFTPEDLSDRLLEVIRQAMPCDAFTTEIYDIITAKSRSIRSYDTLEGKIQPVANKIHGPLDTQNEPLCSLFNKKKSVLIHRDTPSDHAHLHPFGDASRRSAFLLFSPLIVGDRVFGFISVQSYTPKAYTHANLELFEAIVRQVGPALEAAVLAKQLRESEEKYRTLIEMFPHSVMIIQNQKIVFANETTQLMLGYSLREDIVGHKIREILAEGEKERIDRFFQNRMNGTSLLPERLETILKKKNAGEFPAEVFVKDMTFEGKPAHQLIVMDITERKNAEQKLNRVHDIYRAAIEHAQGAPYVLDYTRNNYSFVSEKFGEIVGLPLPEITYNKMKEMTKEVIITDPEGPSDVGDYIKAFKSCKTKRYQTDIRVITPQGEEKWFSDYSVPVIDEKTGKVISSLGILLDITERKRTEEAREVLRRLTGQLTEPLGMKQVGEVVAKECRNLFGYDAFMLCYFDRENNISYGIYCEDTPEGEDKPLPQIPLDLPLESVKKSETFQGRSSLVNRPEIPEIAGYIPFGDTSRLSSSAMYVPIIRAGTAIGMLTVQSYTPNRYTERDVELLENFASQCSGALMRVRAEEELRKYSQQLKDMVEQRTQELRAAQEELVGKEKLAVLGQLAGGVGHELRNPLGVISNAVYFLKSILTDADPTVKEYLDFISTEVGSAEKIVTDLLSFPNIKPALKEEVRILDLVRESLDKHAPPQNIQTAVNISPDLPPICVDPHQINQVLVNLFLNAYQAMPDGGTLTIDAALKKNRLLVSIRDTGCGIPPKNMKKIFEPLFTTKLRGIGLGLSLSRNLVEINGGTIEVESEEGKGSAFTLFFPSV